MHKLIIIISLFSVSTFANGQNHEFGLRGGLNFSTLKNQKSEYDGYEPKIGILIGGIFKNDLNDKFGISSEVLYSMEGANFENSNNYIRIHRLSFPILVSYNLSKKITVGIGPELKLQLDVKSNLYGDISSLYDPLDYGGTLQFEFKPINSIGISLRNYFGLKYQSVIQITDINANEIEKFKSDKSNVLNVSVTYYFGN